MIYPILASVGDYVRNTDTASWTPFSAAPVVPGELLLFYAVTNADPDFGFNPVLSTASPGWTLRDQRANSGNPGCAIALFTRRADAATAALTVDCNAAGNWAGLLLRYRTPTVASAVATTSDSDGDATIDPNNINPGFGLRDFGFVAAIGWGKRENDPMVNAAAPPAGYGNLNSRMGTLVGVAIATRNASVTSENPSAFTMTGNAGEAVAMTWGMYITRRPARGCGTF